MDRGWATGRGRALWTTLGLVVALALIGGSLIALNRSLLSFDGWLSGSQPAEAQQTLTPEPDIVIGTRSIGGGTAAAPGIPSPSAGPLVPVLPSAARGGGAAGARTPGGGSGGGGATGPSTRGGATAGMGGTGGTGGTGAPGAAGGLEVSPPTAGAPSTG